jgi:hypothetical protein
MPSGYKVSYVLVCDLIRRELSGKDLVVGIYNDFIPFASFPASMPTICFRISLRLERDDFKFFHFSVKTPDGIALINAARPLPSPNTNYQTVINMEFVRPVFPRPGRYSIHFGLDEFLEEIGFIILASSDWVQQTLARGTTKTDPV